MTKSFFFKTLFILFATILSSTAIFAQTKPAAVIQDNPNAPVVFIEETLFDYGTIEQNGNGNHNFIYKNLKRGFSLGLKGDRHLIVITGPETVGKFFLNFTGF